MTTLVRAGLAVALLLLSSAAASAQEWETVGNSGTVFFVYVEPEGFKDKNFIAQVLGALMQKHSGIDQGSGGWRKHFAAYLFDDKRYTPQAVPMTDKQILHMRAQYIYNPTNGTNEFKWITIKNAKASPPSLKSTPDHIRPGIPYD